MYHLSNKKTMRNLLLRVFTAQLVSSVSHAVSLMETSCSMKVTFPASHPVTLESALLIETSVANYWTDRWITDRGSKTYC
jgi:hypothetical protein